MYILKMWKCNRGLSTFIAFSWTDKKNIKISSLYYFRLCLMLITCFTFIIRNNNVQHKCPLKHSSKRSFCSATNNLEFFTALHVVFFFFKVIIQQIWLSFLLCTFCRHRGWNTQRSAGALTLQSCCSLLIKKSRGGSEKKNRILHRTLSSEAQSNQQNKKKTFPFSHLL